MGIPDSLHAQQPSLQTSRSPFPSRSSPHRFSLQYNPFILIIMALTCQSNPLPLDQEIPHGYIQGIEHKLISRIVIGTACAKSTTKTSSWSPKVAAAVRRLAGLPI